MRGKGEGANRNKMKNLIMIMPLFTDLLVPRTTMVGTGVGLSPGLAQSSGVTDWRLVQA